MESIKRSEAFKKKTDFNKHTPLVADAAELAQMTAKQQKSVRERRDNSGSVAFLLGDSKMPQRQSINWTLPDAKKPFATVGGQQRYVHDVTGVADIAGARAASTKKYEHMHKFANKPHFFAPDDVEGSHPRRQVPEQPLGFSKEGQDRTLKNRDIEHCYPESKLFTTPRIVNPLNPVYNLPPCKQALPPPSPPRRDPLTIDDIDGTRAKPVRVIAAGRNTLDTTDIPLSTAGSLAAAKKRKSTSRMMETRDITHPPELDVEPFLKHPRGTNPLAPVYKLSAPRSVLQQQQAAADNSNNNNSNSSNNNNSSAMMKDVFLIGDVAGSHPKHRAAERKDRPLLSLRSDDILGSRPRHLHVIRQKAYDERNGGQAFVKSAAAANK